MANNDIIVSEMTPASQINTGDLMIMTQPDAQSETGYSTKSGTVLQVSNKMLKGTNYETDLPSFANKNVLGGLEELKGDIFNLLPVDEASGSIANFETELAAPLQSLLVNVLATGGNGTPDNPNPINGYTAVNLTDCGVNLWDEEWEVSGTGTASKNYIPVKGNTNYYFKIPTGWLTVTEYDSSKTPITTYSVVNNTKTVSANCAYLKFVTSSAYGTTYNNDISINYPSTDTSYRPYTGNTCTIAFGQTVYGGVLDVTRGKLTVTKAYKDLGTLNYTKYDVSQGTLFRSDEFDIKKVTNTTEVPNIISSAFVAMASANRANYTISMTNNTARIDIIDNDYSDAVAFKSAMSGVQLVYELTTPFDIDLTPEVISAVVGENNVFADCGGDTSVKFKDTIQHYIDKKIAQTQALIL